MTPVVFIVFNRPELTARVLSQIRVAKPPILFVVADGPRERVPTDRARCAAVRQVIEDGVNWPCELVLIYSDENLGCGRRVSSGITSAFTMAEEVIVLEDDCLPDPTFFKFCEALLGYYQDEPKVAHIGGSNFQLGRVWSESSYYFSRYSHCWGWATWRRAWMRFSYEIPGPESLKILHEMSSGERRHWRYVLAEANEGRIDSWAYRWQVANWMSGALSIVPRVNLVENIGFGADATHTRTVDPALRRAATPMSFPLVHPLTIGREGRADEITAELFYRPPSFRLRMKNLLRKVLHR